MAVTLEAFIFLGPADSAKFAEAMLYEIAKFQVIFKLHRYSSSFGFDCAAHSFALTLLELYIFHSEEFLQALRMVQIELGSQDIQSMTLHLLALNGHFQECLMYLLQFYCWQLHAR